MVELKSFSELSKSTSVEIQTYTSSPRFYNNGKYFINTLLIAIPPLYAKNG